MRARRDPRTERQARLLPGGDRPRFALIAVAQSPRPRRDPRALRRAATVAVAVRPRIDWQAGRTGRAARAEHIEPGAQAVSEPERRVIADPAFLVLAVPDHPGGALSDHDRQVIGEARQLADAGGGAVVVLAAAGIDGLDMAGADRVMMFQPADAGVADDDPEGRAAAVLAAIGAFEPRHVLFPESADGGADLARRVAAAAGARLFGAVEAMTGSRVSRRMRGGSMEMAAAPTALMSIAENAFAAHEGPRHEARALEAPAFSPARRIGNARTFPVDASHLSLTDADFILSGGNGVTDWASFAELSRVLGATPGGSRAVCDKGHLPRDRQVGASGSVVTARCYLAFGIAGAPQHLQGITEVGHVVAVNTDLHAEMIKRADLAIIADAQEVMPALIAHASAAAEAKDLPALEHDRSETVPRGPRALGDAKLRVAVLLSVGRHPGSGRTRRAPLDARALEMALGLPGAEVHAIHAGDPAEPALRDYLGMGLDRLAVLSVREGGDPVPALAAHLETLAPHVILCGNRAEGGEDSGMLPYLIAQALGCATVADVSAIAVYSRKANLTQALPRGKRRRIETGLPVVAAVNAAAPAPRQSAFARARRGIIEPVAAEASADALTGECEIRPWRPRPKRMPVVAGNASDRLKAMTETRSGEGAVMIHAPAEEAARAIYDYLLEKRIIGESR